MRNGLFKNNLSLTQKICLTGLLIAVVTILQKVLAINYIPIIPFLRISLGGPAVIIFSSIFLGPLYGLFIGAASDVLGYFLLDPKMMGYLPQITIIYSALGFFSFFVFAIFKVIKNHIISLIAELITFLGLFVFVTVFVFTRNNLHLYSQTYALELWQKILICTSMLLLLVFLFISSILFEKKYKKDTLPISPINISISCFFVELIIMVILGSIMKGSAFGFQTYMMILVCQIIVMFINVPLNTWLLILLLRITNRFNK